MASDVSQEELEAAVRRTMEDNEEFRRKVRQATKKKKEGFLTRLVKRVAEAIFGSALVSLARRVAQAILGAPPY